jgi:hypothetical protein
MVRARVPRIPADALGQRAQLSQAAGVLPPWLLSVSLITCTVPARAEPVEEAIRIQYSAPSTCPDAASFTAQVRERTARGRLARADELARTFDVRLLADARGFAGDIEFLNDSGAKVNRQVRGEQCEAVVSGLALIMALALDATLRSADSAAMAAPLTAAIPAATAPTTTQARAPTSPSAPMRVTRPALRAIRAGVLGAYGSATSAPQIGVLGELEFRSGRSVRFLAHGAWHELAVDAGRSASLRRLGLETSICPIRADWGAFALTPCAAFDFGALRAAGVPSARLTSVDEETIWFASVGAQLALSWRFAAPFWLELRAASEFPLRAGYRFTFQNPPQTAYQVPVVAGWAGLAAGVRFW